MDRTIKTELVNINLFKQKPYLLEESIKLQRVELFKQLDIKDDQPIVLTFKSMNMSDLYRSLRDPLGDVELKTTVRVDYPATRHVVINKLISETYIEHKSFWQKLKLLFSKKSVYTKETNED